MVKNIAVVIAKYFDVCDFKHTDSFYQHLTDLKANVAGSAPLIFFFFQPFFLFPGYFCPFAGNGVFYSLQLL